MRLLGLNATVGYNLIQEAFVNVEQKAFQEQTRVVLDDFVDFDELMRVCPAFEGFNGRFFGLDVKDVFVVVNEGLIAFG